MLLSRPIQGPPRQRTPLAAPQAALALILIALGSHCLCQRSWLRGLLRAGHPPPPPAHGGLQRGLIDAHCDLGMARFHDPCRPTPVRANRLRRALWVQTYPQEVCDAIALHDLGGGLADGPDVCTALSPSSAWI